MSEKWSIRNRSVDDCGRSTYETDVQYGDKCAFSNVSKEFAGKLMDLQRKHRKQQKLRRALEAEVKRLRDALSHTRKVLTSTQPETLATWPGRRMTEAVAIIDAAIAPAKRKKRKRNA